MKKLILDGKETNYLVSEQGEIFNEKTGKFLTGNVGSSGYKSVKLTVEGKKKGLMIHRLVALTFIENDDPTNKNIVNHKDGDKLNNSVDNLEWISQSGNAKHSCDNNLNPGAYGRRRIADIKEDNVKWKRYKTTNYLVSKDGEVYNTYTKILLKPVNSCGYNRYSLRIEGTSKSLLAHRLVYETWVRDLTEEEIINHKDGNKKNNNLDNLEITTKKDNSLHFLYELNKNIVQVKQYDVNGDLVDIYPSMSEAAKAVGGCPSGISQAVNGKIYLYKGYRWEK